MVQVSYSAALQTCPAVPAVSRHARSYRPAPDTPPIRNYSLYDEDGTHLGGIPKALVRPVLGAGAPALYLTRGGDAC